VPDDCFARRATILGDDRLASGRRRAALCEVMEREISSLTRGFATSSGRKRHEDEIAARSRMDEGARPLDVIATRSLPRGVADAATLSLAALVAITSHGSRAFSIR